MTQKTYAWSCKACGRSGEVKLQNNDYISARIRAVDLSHQKVSPDCEFDTDKITVKLPAVNGPRGEP